MPSMIDIRAAREQGLSDEEIVAALRELEGLSEQEAREQLERLEQHDYDDVRREARGS